MPPTMRGHARWVHASDREVVQEQRRSRTVTDDVVGTHRDQVLADRVEAAEPARDVGLGPDTVRRRHEHGPSVALRYLDRRAKGTDAAEQVAAGDVEAPRSSSTARSPASTSTPASA